MKRLSPALFATATAVLAVPFLSPCGHSLILAGVDRAVPDNVVFSFGGKLEPPKELLKWAAIPLPAREVVMDSQVTRAALLTEVSLGAEAHEASKRGEHQINAFGLVHDALLLAALTDPIGLSMIENNASKSTPAYLKASENSSHEPFTSGMVSKDRMRCLIIGNSPYIELSAPSLKYTTSKGQPELALATGGARITVITSNGSFYAIASKIHYRKSAHAVTLEGSPLIKTGTRYYATQSSSTLLRIDLQNNHLSANGPMRLQADVTGHD